MLIMDKVIYNNYNKTNPRSSNFKDAFLKGLTRKGVKKALCNINSLRDKYNTFEDGFMNDVLYYLFLALNVCDFTDIQKERLDMWLDGYTESDIAAKYNVSRWVVSKSLNASCDKIISFLRDEVS